MTTSKPLDISCSLCSEKIGDADLFYRVQFTQHKRSEVLADGIKLRPYILCSMCATQNSSPKNYSMELARVSSR